MSLFELDGGFFGGSMSKNVEKRIAAQTQPVTFASLEERWPEFSKASGLEILIQRLRQLRDELHKQAQNLIKGGNGWEPQPNSDRAAAKNECADKLSAILGDKGLSTEGSK